LARVDLMMDVGTIWNVKTALPGGMKEQKEWRRGTSKIR